MYENARSALRSILERLSPPESEYAGLGGSTPAPHRLYERLLRSFPGMAYRCRNDSSWSMEYASHGCRSLLGFDPHDLVENRVVSFAMLIHPDDRQRVWDAMQHALVTDEAFDLTYRIRRVDGTERWVWDRGRPVLGPRGGIEALEGFITDVTDHEAFRARSSDRDAQFRALVEQSLTGVYLIRDGRFAYVNPRFCRIFGRSAEEITALPSTLELVHPDHRALVRENIARRIEGHMEEIRYEFQALAPDGGELVVEVHGRRIELDGDPAIIGCLVDVTDRRKAQQRYHEAQKMEALGQLAAGVAHDFNNVLAVIKAAAQLLTVERSDDDALARDLADIIDATARGVSLSRQLTRFGRSRQHEGTVASLSQVAHDLMPMLQRLVGDGIELNLSLDATAATATVHPTHAEEVIVNLVVNARDAMPEGGTLGIATRESLMDGNAADKPPRRAVVLEVRDTGSGIPLAARSRIFEPYFTTKGENGTGLGLSNVWRIARDAGGTVELESEIGKGSTFRVVLPASRPEATGTGVDVPRTRD